MAPATTAARAGVQPYSDDTTGDDTTGEFREGRLVQARRQRMARIEHDPDAATAPNKRRRVTPIDVVDSWCAVFSESRDPAVRDRIASHHQWLSAVCARRMMRREEQFDDLLQVANVGLLKAIDRFDPSFRVSFHTFASATILGELRRHYRTVWRVRVPRSMQERYVAVNTATDELTTRLERTPTPADIADHLGLALDDVLEALSVGSALWVGTLTGQSDDWGDAPPCLAARDARIEDAPERLEVRRCLSLLPPLQREVVYLSVFEEMRQSDIGERLGLTQVQVSRTFRRAVSALRELMTLDRPEPVAGARSVPMAHT